MYVAVIPARGGSKRIPRKNIKLFHGKPMIAWSIEAAKEARCFDQIVVSTDDHEIAEVARACGASVPFMRSKELSGDFAGTNAVVADALRHLDGVDVEFACCIYATAPFLKASYIRQGLDILVENSSFDFAVSVTSFPFPIQRAVFQNGGRGVSFRERKHRMTRSQDLEEMFHDAGQIYWGSADAFLKEKPLFDDNTQAIQIPRYLVQDIDTPEDWEKAELMFGYLSGQGLI